MFNKYRCEGLRLTFCSIMYLFTFVISCVDFCFFVIKIMRSNTHTKDHSKAGVFHCVTPSDIWTSCFGSVFFSFCRDYYSSSQIPSVVVHLYLGFFYPRFINNNNNKKKFTVLLWS